MFAWERYEDGGLADDGTRPRVLLAFHRAEGAPPASGREEEVWHAMMVFQSADDSFAWGIEFNLPPEIRSWHYSEHPDRFRDSRVRVSLPTQFESVVFRNVIELCERIRVRGDELPAGLEFGVNYAGGRFSPDANRYEPANADELGLDCASFLLALFETTNAPLVKRAVWPKRPISRTWRAHLMVGLSGEQREAVLRSGDVVTFRPTEVCGACLADPPGVAYTVAREAAQALEDRWLEHHNRR